MRWDFREPRSWAARWVDSSRSAALAHPERVDRLILVGMPVGLASTAPLPLRLIGGIPGLSRLFMAGRPFLESPAQCAELILEFLAETGAAMAEPQARPA